MEIKILSERIGLKPTATAEEIVERVHALGDENKRLKEQSEMWRTSTEKLQIEMVEARKAVEKVTEMEGKLIIETAVRELKLDKAEAPFFTDMYKKDPDGVKKFIEDRAWRNYLTTEQRLKGATDEPVDVEGRINALAAEKIANDPTKKLTESSAKLAVLRENPELSRMYRDKTVLGLRKDGDR